MPLLDALQPLIRDQLTPDAARPGNFHGQARESRRLIAQARADGDLRAERSEAARFGGVVKRWRRWLIEQITEATLAGRDTSRDSVRAWQQRVFGQSVDSARLKRYATPERSGGGRSAPLAVDEAVEREARAFYERYRDALKQL